MKTQIFRVKRMLSIEVILDILQNKAITSTARITRLKLI